MHMTLNTTISHNKLTNKAIRTTSMKSSQLGAVCRVSTVRKLSLDHCAVSFGVLDKGTGGPDSSPIFSSADHGEISKEAMVLCQRHVY